jgi:hypothetical protein
MFGISNSMEVNMTSTDLAEQWRSMQKMFQPTSAISESLKENTRRYWENEQKLLDTMQTLANGWFERRHAGTNAAREAGERMCSTESFPDLMVAYQNWASGVFERIMADCQQIVAVTGAFTSPPLAPSAIEKPTEQTRSETRSPARAKTS